MNRIISLVTFLIITSQAYSIVGFGASHSTTVLIYHFELRKFLKYIVDDNIEDFTV